MEEKGNYTIRMAYEDEWQDAMALTWKTFMKYEADDYTGEGIKSFEDFITDETLHKMFLRGNYQMMVALEKEKIVGVITLRNESHISLLFVDEKYHRRGVGRSLIHHLAGYTAKELGIFRLTVNAAPYGVEFYHKVGFKDLGPEMQNSGIRYTPMELYI